MNTPSAIVLAAGRGERMGGPKALLSVDGATLVQRHVWRLRELGCGQVVVVVRPEVAPQVVARLPEGVRVVAACTASQADTLGVGVRALGPLDQRPVVVTPIDLLPPRLEIFQRLLRQLEDGAWAATPVYEGRDGHPVVLRAEALLAYQTRAPLLRDLLASLPQRRRVEVDTADILGDLDVPADVVAAVGRGPVFAPHPALRATFP